MAGRGRIPKPGHLLQRNRRRKPGAATLATQAESANRDVPALPTRESRAEVWHPRVVEWWESVWRSPMAGEYIGPDMEGGLFILAELYQQRWTCTETKDLVRLAAEIRLQEIRFGLSPVDRVRLQWTIERGEAAEERAKARKRSARPDPDRDPRDVLKIIT
ncbi:MAG: hypothetical protein ACKVZ0_00110 [Gemmatimonadales bacterium]